MAYSRGRHISRSGASILGTMSNWMSGVINARIAERQKRTVYDRSWDLYTNDAMSHGLIESFLVEIVGTGLTPQAQPMLRWLGMDNAWQEEYQAKNYDLFEIWGLDVRNLCDAQRRLNIYMMQALALFYWKLDGIAVFQVVTKPDKYRPLSLSILPIDSSRLVTPVDLKSRDDVYDGIALDSDGAPKSAYILKTGKRSTLSARVDDCVNVPIHDPDTGLPKLLLVCDVRNIAEYRQDSILSPMIKEIKDSNDLTDAAIVKTLINNLISLFIEDKMSTDRTKLPIEDRMQEMSKGTILFGAAGEVPHEIGNATPGPGYKDVNEAIVGRLGMSSCRGPESIAKSYKASYSASQANIENAGKYDDVERAVLINRFCQPIEVWKQYESALRGLIPVKNVKHFAENLHAYTRSIWFPPKARPIDKLKAAKARETDLANGSTTYSDIHGERSQDWRAARRQRAIELAFDMELETEYGIKFKPETEPPQGQQPDQPENQPERDDDE
ncbi:MAG: phage portal protein [Pseudomonadota bacterium]